MNKNIWINKTIKKYANKKFEGSYQQTVIKFTGKMERTFVLKSWKKNGELGDVISFDSWQMAKKNDWEKVSK